MPNITGINVNGTTYDIVDDGAVRTVNNVSPTNGNVDVSETRVLTLDIASFSSLPQTVSNVNINSNMVVLNSVLGTPSSQTGDWTVTTNNGSLTISGSISGSTTLTLYLMEQRS